MIWGHVIKIGEQYLVNTSMWTRFPSAAAEEFMKGDIVVSIAEETGDFDFLRERLIRFASTRGISIANIDDLQTRNPPSKDEIEKMLRGAARALSARLDMVERKLAIAAENMKALLSANDELTNIAQGWKYFAEIDEAIVTIVEQKYECEHIRQATNDYWEYRRKTDQ